MDEVTLSLFLQMERVGKSASQIAQEFGITQRTVYRWRRNLGLTRPIPEHAGHPISRDRLSAVEAMLSEGAPYEEVTRSLHVSAGTLRKYFPGLSWSASDAARFGSAVRKANKQIRRNHT